MTLTPGVRRALLAAALLLLLAVAWTGFRGGVEQLSQARTAGQKVHTFLQFAYGISGLLGGVGTRGATGA